jgi:2-succinyl-5-enolpyruvyl-6-hydroxy-3-cyclohexene-1-carboxylate synthase
VVRERPAALAGDLGLAVGEAGRGVIVAGRSDARLRGLPALAQACNYPLLADPLSGARSGDAAIAHYDLLLRDPTFAAAHRPDVVIRVGDLPTSKALRTWLGGLDDARQIAVDPQGAWQDPDAVLELSLSADPARLTPPAPGDAAWLADWRAADSHAAAAVARILDPEPLSELGVARLLAERLPADATLYVASSMPVREIETVWPARADAPRVLSNRGANGIDGTLSSAFGARAASGGPVCALVGDIAFAHDVGGLLAASRLDLPLAIVLLDNGGGGIFDHLPIAGESDVYEQHVATPTAIAFDALARAYGLAYAAPGSQAELSSQLSEALAREHSTLIHVKVERSASLELNRRLVAAVLDQLTASLPTSA